MTDVIGRYIAEDLGLPREAVQAALALFLKGASVPFIARYRKEAVGGLDEVALRAIHEKLTYYAELQSRKDAILTDIARQGRLAPSLQDAIAACRHRYALEDLYMPYRVRERTAATIAAEKGLGPLAEAMMDAQPVAGNRAAMLAPFVDASRGIATAEMAAEGAREIVIERICEDATLRGALRKLYLEKGILTSRATAAAGAEKTKYENYYRYAEPLAKAPSHRLLAIRRGAREKILAWEIEVSEPEAFRIMDARFVREKRSIFHADLLQAIYGAYRRTLATALEVEAFRARLEEAEREAITVFARNARELLLAAPALGRVTMGVDPGQATGAKIAVVGPEGELKEHVTVYLHASERQRGEAARTVADLARRHAVELIAVGNGTGSKETRGFIAAAMSAAGSGTPVFTVSEAGASVYSASDAARREFADLDITIRGAVSIARRVQDPLAELVKIDPKSIGVGQYQHDVNQTALGRALAGTVESCVNHVGVELNTASAELLAHVSGIGPSRAAAIVSYRRQRGAFRERRELLRVPLMDEDAFLQAAGFLKIRGGSHPLDNSTIHPERYTLVERMASDLGLATADLAGNAEAVGRIDPARYVSAEAGIVTIRDILEELVKPGVDPREAFDETVSAAGPDTLDDLSVGMTLTGVVTNVTAFGAFVDIGVHQDGLVHISRMSERFVKDPHEVLSPGERVRVRVLAIDKALSRVSLALEWE